MTIMNINKATFAAYTQLTLEAKFINHIRNGEPFGGKEGQNKSMNFIEFQKAIEEDKVVNKNLSRETSKYHKQILEDKLKYGTNAFFSTEVAKIVNKAFKLGLVGNDEYLISKYEERM
jgi:hypothetical protein